jgi:hypothetical protein
MAAAAASANSTPERPCRGLRVSEADMLCSFPVPRRAIRDRPVYARGRAGIGAT